MDRPEKQIILLDTLRISYIYSNGHRPVDRIEIDELPAKGKKKLRRFSAETSSPYMRLHQRNINTYFMLCNLVDFDFPTFPKEASFETVTEAIASVLDGKVAEYPEAKHSVHHRTELLSKNEIPLPGFENEIDVQCKDFHVKISWKSFRCYDPKGDYQNHDPSYVEIVNKSEAAARKLYKLYKKNPEALTSLCHAEFEAFLTKSKVAHRLSFSQWR